MAPEPIIHRVDLTEEQRRIDAMYHERMERLAGQENLQADRDATWEECQQQRTRAEAAESELRDLRKALTPAAGQSHRFVAVVGACSDRVDFTRLIRVVGPFDTAEAAKAAGEIECARHRPDVAHDDEVSIEFEVVAWQEARR